MIKNAMRRCWKCGTVYSYSTREDGGGIAARCPTCRGQGVKFYKRRIMLRVKTRR